jgi:hypothetical protein
MHPTDAELMYFGCRKNIICTMQHYNLLVHLCSSIFFGLVVLPIAPLWAQNQPISTNASSVLNLTCSEINYNSDPSTSSGNWIELHNYGTTSINLANHRLQKQGSGTFYTIPSNSAVIPAGGYVVLVDDLAQFQAAYPGITDVIGSTQIPLSNGGDTIELRDPAGALLLTIGYDDSGDWPQCADGYGRTLESRNPNATANLLSPANWRDGCMGGSPGGGYEPCYEPLFFNEINYRSSDANDAGDWVELWNRTGQSLNLSGWQLRDSRDTLRYTFPNGTSIASDGYLVIYNNLSKFQAIHGTNVANKIGPFEFGFNGDGEIVRLFDQNEVLQLSMFYNDAAPWPLPPDGEGPSLELRAPFTDLNEGQNWAASCFFGTPGRLNSDCSMTDVATPADLPALRVLPNPSAGVFWVEMPDVLPTTWQVSDLSGRVLMQGNTALQTAWSLDLGAYPAGAYVLRVRGARPVLLIKN